MVDQPELSPAVGEGFEMIKLGERRIENNMTGYKVATSVGGLSTGERASEELFVNFSWRLRSAIARGKLSCASRRRTSCGAGERCPPRPGS